MALWRIDVSWRTGICGGDYLVYAVEADSKEDAERLVKDEITDRYEGRGHYRIIGIVPLFETGSKLTVVSCDSDQ